MTASASASLSREFGLAVCQMTSTDSVEKNFKQVLSLLEQITPNEKISLASFPENSLYMRVQEGEKVQGLQLTDDIFKELSAEAKKRNLWMHFGSVPLNEKGSLWNASILIEPSGKVSSSYQKIHLFDIDLEGQPPVRESDIYKHGDSPQILEIHGWQIGQTICYDLRFSELFSWYAQHSVEMILVPSSFLVKTGQVHWEVLLRARAIESQAYIVAAAQAGTHQSARGKGTRETYGHSLVVDPWGKIIAEAQSMGPEILKVHLDLGRIEQVRKQIPMRSHRRLVQIKR